MNNNELGILLSAIIDKVDSERKINKVIKQIEVEAVKLNIQIDDKMAKSIAKDFTKQLANEQKKMQKEIEDSYKLLADEKVRQEKSAYTEKSRLEKQELAEQKKMAQEIAAYEKQLANEQKKLDRDAIKSSELQLRSERERFNLARRIRGYLKTNTRVANSEYGDQLSGIADELYSGNIDQSKLKETTATISKIKAEANAAGLEGQNMWDKLTGKYAEYGRFLLVSGSIALLRKSLAEAIRVVKELDKAFVNLQMVTGGTAAQTTGLMKSYNKIAQELGATTAEIATAGNEFLRQGLSIADTNKLIESSTILSKVGMLGSAEATQYLTSAMKGYGVSVSDTLNIVDKLSAVDMESATSAGGLAEAMSKTATGAKLAGIEMDKLLGMLAATAEVTQADMASVGTAYRTIFARMSNIKLGKLEDEDGESISEYLSDAEQALDRVDIKLRKSATEFNNFGDIFDQLGSKWKELSQVDQNVIATAFSGKMCARAA